MATDDKDQNTESKGNGLKADPETLHTTDPQEHMEGPISSLMHKTEETFKEDETVEKKED